MKLMGEAGDAMGLLGLARAQKIPGATETLDFDHINCANWLNKYVIHVLLLDLVVLISLRWSVVAYHC
jgi:hypothetical protein